MIIIIKYDNNVKTVAQLANIESAVRGSFRIISSSLPVVV
jgi:hypothetical protein